MGSASRQKPQKLAEKLLQIRLGLNLSQSEILAYLNLEDKLIRSDISKYERGVREPSLLIILAYARAVGISTDILIDDQLEMPEIKQT